MTNEKLSHLSEEGSARMVDVGEKAVTRRTATATAIVKVGPKIARLIKENGGVSKGNVLETAKLAGIMGGKKTADLIPMCHPIAIDKIGVECVLTKDSIEITTNAVCHGRTGIEMEAMCSASLAALTIYDMVKSLSKGVEITSVRLLEKTGGKSGDWRRDA